jgi:hypothetical protein
MNKFYAIGYNQDHNFSWCGNTQKYFDTYEAAELAAKKKAAKDKDGDDYFVMETVAKVVAPAPEAIVTKF